MDNIDRVARSKIMRAIRGNALRPELFLRSALRKARVRGARRGVYVTEGRCYPDFVFDDPQAVVFVDGCFWHGCPWHYKAPRNRRWRFWRNKLYTNVGRDALQNSALRAAGWRVMRVWECRTNTPTLAADTAAAVKAFLEESWPGTMVRVPEDSLPVVDQMEGVRCYRKRYEKPTCSAGVGTE